MMSLKRLKSIGEELLAIQAEISEYRKNVEQIESMMNSDLHCARISGYLPNLKIKLLNCMNQQYLLIEEKRDELDSLLGALQTLYLEQTSAIFCGDVKIAIDFCRNLKNYTQTPDGECPTLKFHEEHAISRMLNDLSIFAQ
ncbi:unnamed protein product [Caenorhabditis bovis]|uniref:Uncharacterized protein n=1 Tax=Caenorhabditis bovis TaxID=2654633 RepID=A0A8S1F482_9PELO|nr:unnamed protein product [Caenorhabditis bovis]